MIRAPLAMEDTGVSILGEQLSMPARWKGVHDCERPARWRTSMDDADCKIYKEELRADRVAAADGMMRKTSKPSRKYSDVVPQLITMDDFLEANERGRELGQLVLVKFYSNKCRACLRIATKYRRLAIDYEGKVICYEACLQDARSLLERLDVSAVPSVQIFDGEDITRLASYSCHPKEWSKVDSKIRTAMKSMSAGRHGLHAIYGEPLLDILTNPLLGGQ